MLKPVETDDDCSNNHNGSRYISRAVVAFVLNANVNLDGLFPTEELCPTGADR